MPRQKVTTNLPNDPVYAFLRALRHTGPMGFEGLVAHLLEAQLGQRFRLADSGFQAGMDAKAEPGPAGANRIKVETKHYFKSSLDLRELTAEIIQACRSDDCDVWVLVCTCPVSNQHAVELEQIAAEEGVECVFLDRPNTGVDRVAVLMASHEDSVIHWSSHAKVVVDEPGLRSSLEELRKRTEYETTRTQLAAKLSGSLVGYADASRRARDEFVSVISDKQSCEAIFNQDVAVLAAGRRRILRRGVVKDIDSWWRKGTPASPHLAALGEEGQGKTWAVMGWLADRAVSNEMPLLLSCNASVDIRPGDTLEALLPKLLLSWTHLKTKDWWQKRLEHWIRCPTPGGPFILVLVDGLNENVNVNWIDFFRPLQHQRWRGQIALIVTDRPGHWEQCARLQRDGFNSLAIQGYSNQELQEALAAHPEIDLRIIPNGLLPLLSTPRYCELVAQHYGELKESGDFTRERLVLLDAADRQTQKRGYPLTESQLIEVIQRLARQYRETTTLDFRSISSLSREISDSHQVRQEIIDGGLLVRVDGGPGNRYRVEKSRLIFGLGMLLADNVRQIASIGATAPAIAEDIASWLEPHPEIDLKVEISAAAVYLSYLDSSFPIIARKELIKHWLSSRNAWLEYDEARLSIVLKGPEDFISVTEDLWRSDRRSSATQGFLGEALCRHRDNPCLKPHLIRAVCRWMGFAHAAGHRLFRGQDETNAQRVVAEIAARAGHDLLEGPMTFLGESLTIVEDDGLLTLVRLGLRIMSAGSREPYVPGIFAWAAAGALMGRTLEYDEVAWVIRLSSDDLEPLILPTVERFLSSNSVDAHRAGRLLINALGTATAVALGERYPQAEDSAYLDRLAQHKANPCVSFFSWSDEECERCLSEHKAPIHLLLDRAKLHLLDPNRPVHLRVAAHLRDELSNLNPSALRTNLSSGSEDHRLEQTLPLMAAQVPDELAESLRSVVRDLPLRSTLAQRQLSFELLKYFPLMREAEVKALRTALSALRANSVEWGTEANIDNAGRLAEAYTTWALLPTLNAAERYAEVICRPSNAGDLDQLDLWFEKLEQSLVEVAFDDLAQNTDRLRITRTLWLLGSSQAVLTDGQRQVLETLWSHENEIVRGMIARCAVLLKDESLGRTLVEAERKIDRETNRWEARWLFALLKEHSLHIPLETILARVDAPTASYLLPSRGLHNAEVSVYAGCLDQLWAGIVEADDSIHTDLLPEINVDPAFDREPTTMPDIRDEPRKGLSFKDSSTTWKVGEGGFPSIGGDPEEESNAFIARFNARQDAILKAWKSDALRCFGKNFSRETLRAVCVARPDLCRGWVAAASEPGISGKRVRVRMGSFLVYLCEALLESDQEAAITFLHDYMVNDEIVRFDVAAMLFRVPRSELIDAVRDKILSRIVNDLDLAHFTVLAQSAADGWMDELIGKFVDSPNLARKATGLCIASYCHSSESTLEDWIVRAGIEKTWVEREVLDTLRRNHRRDRFASAWFERFLNEEDADRSWAAFEVAVHLADERWYLWNKNISDSLVTPREDRIKIIEMNWQHVKRNLRRERERKDHLFGIKIPKGEVFPF